MAWKTDNPVFPRVLKFLHPLVLLHPGFKRDPLLGGFLSGIETFLAETPEAWKHEKGIKAFLVGRFRIFVDGKEIDLEKWHSNKALKAFAYLLLSPNQRIPNDHLFYLLWPRNSYGKHRSLIYTAIDTIRKRIGRRDLLTKKKDFYQLEDTWTDLGEIENLVRLADATHDPVEKEELLSRARELARGELLPEFPYDRHIDEYRQYYERLRKRVFGRG